ncbi:2064_t:CDS:2, partial [Cetraspora pellucida]
MVGKCLGYRWSPKTEKTKDLNKHMDLTQFRPYWALLQLTQAQNIFQTRNTIQAPVDNLALASKGNLISFDKNLPIQQPAQLSMPTVDLLTDDIPEADPEAGPVSKTDKEWFDLIKSNISESKHHEVWQNGIQYAKDMFKVDRAKYAFSIWFIDTEEHKLEAGMTKEANSKYIKDGPNVILTKKTKPDFWIGIDKKFLIREVSRQSEVEELD